MSDDWSPSKKWWLDLLKSLISFAAVAAITTLVLDRFSDRREKQRSQDDAVFQMRVDALRQFQNATLAYEIAVLSAYTDLYQWQGTAKTPAMVHYERDSYSAWNVVMEGATIRGEGDSDLAQILRELGALVYERHEIYDEFVDQRLDYGAETEIEPETRRGEFDSLSKRIAQTRERALRRFEALVLHSPRPR